MIKTEPVHKSWRIVLTKTYACTYLPVTFFQLYPISSFTRFYRKKEMFIQEFFAKAKKNVFVKKIEFKDF